MSPSIAVGLQTLRSALSLLEVALADHEAAPVSVVLIQDRSSGKIHRRVRIDGIPGLMSYEADNADSAAIFDVIPDLSRASDEMDLCNRCFGELDTAGEPVIVGHTDIA